MSLIFSGGVAQGRFSVNRFVELVSTTPAKLFGLYPRKGTIAVGSDADLVIFDPKREHTISAKTHHMRVDYSMFEGIKVTGMPDVVFSRGRVLVEGEKFFGRPGQGEFIKRGASPGDLNKNLSSRPERSAASAVEGPDGLKKKRKPPHAHNPPRGEQQEQMLSAARAAFKNAHAPYSNFPWERQSSQSVALHIPDATSRTLLTV